MDDLNRSIADHIKSNQYYNDCRTWYANKYVFIACTRTYIIFLLIFFLSSLGILAFYYNQTDPAPPKIQYKINSDDIARNYSVIFPAGSSSDEPQVQVTKYILSNYVKKREVYDFKKINDQINFVKNSSVPSEYLKYKWMVSIDNPSSPQMLYVEDYKKDIQVTQVELIKLTFTEQSQAIVYYTELLRNIASNKVDSKNKVAKISFTIDNVENLVGSQEKKLNFMVTNYDTMEIK